ncbi:G-type lectin S-receptor-like serine/threonine-protein kinase CES101 [Malus sylvestris]|uniref:G-type lectin S-receptor-like serine/threonine-protein kinase CES101 n=1 Tax=Malus sylvestris TaxID=3752 RepID=UPI0010AA6F07|nr:G-type lectin S-receptor-like serine/threonine-protein kinase CES101 [Malus domestica]XP_050125547.1 G-type lectin S-receptor-like serine/threonine-protein kinase CES101 [Malus sylvestris]
MKTWRPFHVVFCTFACFFVCLSHASSDTLRHGQYLYSNQTLVSAGGVFELGFFSSPSAPNGYLGIWFKNDKNQKPVWVANRNSPLDSDGMVGSSSVLLTIRNDGNMVIIDRRNISYIVNYDALASGNNTTATLLDSGNLVLMEGGDTFWQSFDYPTDTFLPGMKLGLFNINTEQLRKQFLVSWSNTSVPADGIYALGIDPVNNTQFNVWRSDGAYQQIGLWDGHEFNFFFKSTLDNLNVSSGWKTNEIYVTFSNKNSSMPSWFVLASEGLIYEFTMIGNEIKNVDYSLCDDTMASSSPRCLVRRPSACSERDSFSNVTGMLPSSLFTSWPIRIDPYDCEKFCTIHCSCVAYTYDSLPDGGTICQVYYGNKIDLQKLVGTGNSTIYVRGNASKSDRKLLTVTFMVIPLVFFMLILLLWIKCNSLGIYGFRNGTRDSMRLLLSQLSSDDNASCPNITELGKQKDHELPLLSFSFIVTSTNNFSLANQLGQGGFGPVYKGKLLQHDIAVKRLSKNSGQGPVEFKNEVQLISKLQHRNLVKLLGFCIHREEKILIYEYMPNKSLDSFIFEKTKTRSLNWRQRIHIIKGIAQGLLYLHKYSRLRIIHRDLKISNILLDAYMNPKISDFGLARILSGNECRAKTNRVVGTYGYMSPEYLMHGLFSTKSDVFSFGVIVLEIVSGRKNANFYESDHSLNLLGHAWNLWKSGRAAELMDSTLADSSSMESLVTCIQVGLLCVQDSAEDRPTMSDVVSMLSNEGATLPTPKQTTYSNLTTKVDKPLNQLPSVNLLTFSEVEAR